MRGERLPGENESTAAVLVSPEEGPPAGGLDSGADTGALLAGEHPAWWTVSVEAGGVTPAGARLVLEGGQAWAGDVRALTAGTATGEVVLHRHHGGLTAASSSLRVDNTNSHVPGGKL